MASWLPIWLTFCLLLHCSQSQLAWFQAKSSHQPTQLNSEQLKHVASLSNMQGFDMTLDPILVPRVVGTPSHAKVRQYIVDQMTSLGWHVEVDKFNDKTPLGQKEFNNIITTLDPNAPRRLVLACHYDTKYDPKKETFVGATDSAVPCAMMITLARDLAPKLDQFKALGQSVTLQFLFLDGEEAFVNWDKRRDAIYGAKNLANKWSKTKFPESGNRDGTTHLHRMDLMVLLDLLGAPNPQFFSLIRTGDRWYQRVVNIEQRLRAQGLLSTGRSFFNSQAINGGIEDDHLPFMERNVPILHIIPTPFPDFWHTDGDTKAALDYKTIDDLNKIFRVFVVEYLQMSV